MTRLYTLTTAIGIATALVVATTFSTIAAGGGTAQAPAVSCANLASLSLVNTTITSAAVIEAGMFIPSGASGERALAAAARTYGGLPAFCRVMATLAPSSDSDIKVEVWLPVEDWNGKYQAVGNGAFTGSIRHNSMAAALGRGQDGPLGPRGHGEAGREGVGTSSHWHDRDDSKRRDRTDPDRIAPTAGAGGSTPSGTTREPRAGCEGIPP